MSNLARQAGLWLPVLACMAGLWLLSGRTTTYAPAAGVDKLAHVSAYALFGVLGLRAFHGGLRVPRAAPTALALLLVAGYGALDELHQSWVPGRHASAADWLADCAGAGLALLLVRASTTRLAAGARRTS